MIIKLLNAVVDFSKNSIDNVVDDGGDTPDIPETPDTPDTPDTPVIPDTPVEPDVPVEPDEPDEPSGGIVVPDEMPETYAAFVSSYARDTMDDSQNNALYSFLYRLNESGIMGKIRQLYLPCVMPNWDKCFLNVARYFNKGVENYTKMDLYSNSTLGRCFEVCDYGLYKTSDEIKWGDCLTSNWDDTDVSFDNWHILMFKPAQQDASTVMGAGGLNFRSRSGSSIGTNFAIGSATSATQRVRGGWASGTVTIDGASVSYKNGLFVEPTGWGNGTHDPYCVGISIKDNKLITPSSNYQEFAYNNRNLVNEINEWPLVDGMTLPTTVMTGTYGWGGYYGVSISTQQSLATSVISIGQGLTKDEVQSYMDFANEFMVGMRITNENWDPDRLN